MTNKERRRIRAALSLEQREQDAFKDEARDPLAELRVSKVLLERARKIDPGAFET